METEHPVTIKLVMQTDEDRSVSFRLDRFPATLGRDPDNDVVLNDRSVSRRHAQIILSEDRAFIKDLGSANGIHVDGRKVPSSLLSRMNRVRVGNCEFDLFVEGAPATGEGDWDLGTHSISLDELEAEADRESAAGTLAASPAAVLGFFHEAGKILESAFELDDILRGILELTFRIIPAERGFVLLADRDTGAMVVRARKFRDGDWEPAEGDARLSTTIVEYATKERRGTLTADAAVDDRFEEAPSIAEQAIKGAICVPLKGREKILGAIYIDSRIDRHKFSIADLKLLSAVGAEMGIVVDNARLHETEIRTARLAAVGQAVAGLGHCIKNILNGMEGGSFILQQGIDKGDRASQREGWDILSRNSSRLKDLMLDMLTYSKPREPVYEAIDGNSVPEEVVDLLQEKARRMGVSLDFQPDRTLPRVVLDAKAIYRAVLNLVTNAVEACPADGGHVTVKTVLRPGGEQFQITVGDNGCGICEEHLARLGKAFFSTKGAQGTGLGLTVTYKVIAEHSGNIQVSSQPGKGTTFTVTLPVQGPHAA
jgi:signal transduction histidine kinase